MATEKRLIDANALMEHLTRCIEAEKGLFRAVCVAIKCFVEQMTSVDTVELVGCEKCRYYEKAEYDEGCKMVCRLLKRQTAYNGFCYCGERKDNESRKST